MKPDIDHIEKQYQEKMSKETKGHVTYGLVYEDGEMFNMDIKFSTYGELIHLLSFEHLYNMNEKYQVYETRIEDFIIDGQSKNLHNDILETPRLSYLFEI